jgi:hypothetical protein
MGGTRDACCFAVETDFAYFEYGIKHILLKGERKVQKKLESTLSILNTKIIWLFLKEL